MISDRVLATLGPDEVTLDVVSDHGAFPAVGAFFVALGCGLEHHGFAFTLDGVAHRLESILITGCAPELSVSEDRGVGVSLLLPFSAARRRELVLSDFCRSVCASIDTAHIELARPVHDIQPSNHHPKGGTDGTTDFRDLEPPPQRIR